MANKLFLSNRAHKRLKKKHRDSYIKTGNEYFQQLSLYHGACAVRQEFLGRKFTKDERKKVFSDVIRDFY